MSMNSQALEGIKGIGTFLLPSFWDIWEESMLSLRRSSIFQLKNQFCIQLSEKMNRILSNQSHKLQKLSKIGCDLKLMRDAKGRRDDINLRVYLNQLGSIKRGIPKILFHFHAFLIFAFLLSFFHSRWCVCDM